MHANISQVISDMGSLSSEEVAQVRDFVLFLKSRPRQDMDSSGEWTNDDLHNVTTASIDYGSAILEAEECDVD